jgi:hypothetical protein
LALLTVKSGRPSSMVPRQPRTGIPVRLQFSKALSRHAIPSKGTDAAYRTGFTWQRSQSPSENATLVWQTPQDSPDEIAIIEVFLVPLFVLG